MTDSGTAVPIANVLDVFGAHVVAQSDPVFTTGATNVVTINVQTTSAQASSSAVNMGLASFDSADFSVDANGFVQLSGAGATETLTGNSGGAVGPTANNINTVGTGSITIAGNPGTSTLTTQLTGLTNHNVLVGAGTATITNVSPSTAGFVLTSNGVGADPSFQTISAAGAITTITGNTGGPESPLAGNFNILGTGSITVAGSANTETVQLTGLTNHSLLVGAGTPTITNLGVATNGQLPIGSTGADPVLANITSAGSTISITNGAGSISLDVNGSKVGETITGTTGGALSPTAGNWNILGASTAAGTTPVSTSGAVSTLTINVQKAQAIAATDATKVGLANFNSADFSVDANGFVSAASTGYIRTITGTSGGAESPAAGGNFNILGSTAAAGTTPVVVAGSANTETVKVQISQAIAATDATKVGLANFDSARFTVDANGFVSINGAGIGETITGDSGGALSPTAGNWNILGRSGSKTSGSSSTLTIKSPPYSDQGLSTTVTLNSGSFATAAITLTLPASAGLADGDLFEFVCTTSNALVIQSVSAQKIRIGSLISAAAGTATSTSIGDALILRFRAADGFFYATSVIGTWTIA